MNLFHIKINVSRPGLGRIFSIINQNKLETQHAVRINTVHNRKEKKVTREERRDRESEHLCDVRAVNQNQRDRRELSIKIDGVRKH